MSKVHVKTGDTVVILSGKDRGKKGKVMAVSPKEGKVIVENANIGRLTASCAAATPSFWLSKNTGVTPR